MIRWNEEEIPVTPDSGPESRAVAEQEMMELDRMLGEGGAENTETPFTEMDKPRHFPAVFLYQAALSIVIAIIMVALNTFYFNAYWNIDRYLKSALVEKVDFQTDGKKAVEQIQSVLAELKPVVLEDQKTVSQHSQTESIPENTSVFAISEETT